MSLFLSTFENRIDNKGRVSVPASFRLSLVNDHYQGFVAFRSHKYQSLECCSYQRMQKLSESLDDFNMFSDEHDELAATIFADSHQIPLDSDGRVILPRALLDYAGIADRIAFVGRGSTFQIWNPEDFAIQQEQARKNLLEKKTTLRLKSSNGSESGAA